MSEEPKDNPVRELLKDISRHSAPIAESPRGLVNPKLVQRISFFSSLLGLLLITVLVVGIIWEAVNQAFAFRCIFSICVVVAALYIFRAINSHFE